ncbi:SDR family NAD(P)-dependent oxidoreductase [Embleya sp. NPDC055664]
MYRRALVTGGGSGTGREVANRLTAAGMSVTVWGRSAPALEETVRAGGAQEWRSVDVANADAVAAGVAALSADADPVGLVVHCAGIWTPGALHELTVQALRAHLDAVVLGSVLIARATHTLIGDHPGHFVQVAAASAKPGFPDTALNQLAKRAQDGLHEGLTRELRHSAIRVTTIYPDSVAADNSSAVASGSAMSYSDVADAILYAVGSATSVVPSELVLTAPGSGRWE